MGQNHPINNNIDTFLGRNVMTSRMEKRFQDIPYQAINLKGQKEEDRRSLLSMWLGNSCKEIFSVGFALLEAGDLDGKKIKSFCSENIIRHVLWLSQANELGQSDFEFINKLLAEELLPYFLLKYPLSEDKQANLGFSAKVVEKNNHQNNENDLIFASKVKFEWRENGNYNDKIMEFFNYLIGLPEEQLQQKNENGKNQIADQSQKKQNDEQGRKNKNTTLYKMFLSDMETLFKKIEDEDDMLRMKNQNVKMPVNLKKNSRINQQQSENQSKSSQKQQEQYREKVKSYTDYLIGRKLSENVKPFSKEEIKSCNLNLKDTALMRIVTKWCQELEKCFEENFLIDREQQFRMLDGSTKFIKKDKLIIFQKLLKRQNLKIKAKLHNIMKHNYLSQSDFSKRSIKKQFMGFTEEEGMVGQFSSRIFRNNESYSISHLNNLLHGILTATKNLAKLLTIRSTDLILETKDLDMLLVEIQESVVRNRQKKYQHQAPQLISFMVGDLLRCKCSSHQNEIIALFNEIERINQSEGGILKVVRVKNRLNDGTKDILMNLMYREKLIIEMQLAIKTGKSKFLDCSSYFNHYLYQLKRSQFGPLNQLSNIWTNHDFRGNFYLKKIQELNQPSVKQEGKMQSCCLQQFNLEPIQQPFECSQCKVFYYSQSNYIGEQIQCESCNRKTCLKCRLSLNYQTAKNILMFLPSIQGSVQVCTDLPQQGLLVNLKTQEQDFHYFKKIQHRKYIYLFAQNTEMEGQNYRILKRLKKEEIISFLKDHYIVTSQHFSEKIPKITLEEAKAKFFFLEQLKLASKLSKNFISIVKEGVTDELFSTLSLQPNKWPTAKKINFSENNLSNFFSTCEIFSNSEIVVLDNNQIQEIGDGCTKLKKVKEMYLSGNKIQRISNHIENLTSLTNQASLMSEDVYIFLLIFTLIIFFSLTYFQSI